MEFIGSEAAGIAFASGILKNGGANVMPCPDKTPECFNTFHCNLSCPFAKSAHNTFVNGVGDGETGNNGMRGALSVGVLRDQSASFETINEEVIYDVSVDGTRRPLIDKLAAFKRE
jgi:hypothetical protein